MIPREECNHPELTFGSGDYYIFCYECGAIWATTSIQSDRIAPEESNRGKGMSLSGEKRKII